MNEWKNDRDRAAVENIVRPLRRQLRLDDTFEVRVMSAVHAEALAKSDTVHAGERWWQRRYTLRFTPLGGLAIAASIFGVMLLSTLRPAQHADVQNVHFILVNESAKQVYLVGDFNGWSKKETPLRRTANHSAWTVTIPLQKGRHEYAFIVADENGEHWTADPLTPAVEDEFGTQSSIVSVGTTS